MTLQEYAAMLCPFWDLLNRPARQAVMEDMRYCCSELGFTAAEYWESVPRDKIDYFRNLEGWPEATFPDLARVE